MFDDIQFGWLMMAGSVGLLIGLCIGIRITLMAGLRLWRL